ncbi:MAG TPA: hypothetical protein VK631_10210 [Solirubrobacteraceae bacterium]|nr:hypothetical protein [Solirubrobacteraceae bacterium]
MTLQHRFLLEVLDVADGATLVELRALWPALSVAELDRWLAAATRRGAVERTRPGFEERWRLTRAGRGELDRLVVREMCG